MAGNRTVDYFTTLINNSNRLSKKEKEILTGRANGVTLERLGKKFKVTGERIRQREDRAIAKLLRRFSQLLLFDRS